MQLCYGGSEVEAEGASYQLVVILLRVLSVFGPFNSRVLVEMSADDAVKLVPDGALGAAGPTVLIEAVDREIEGLRSRAPALADSALAASARAMAMEIEHPFNSATSKSMCQARLMDALRELRELAPPEQAKDGLDGIRSGRRLRLAGGSEASA